MMVTKYKNKKVVVNGFNFDSKMEADFYLFLLTKCTADEIKLQPVFELQPKFVKHGKAYRAISYVADFQVGDLVYDVKGFETADFKIKKKLFVFRYPQLHLACIKKCPVSLQDRFGAWVELENFKKYKNKIKR